MSGIATVWNLIILEPMLNVLMAFNAVLHNFGITIIVFTVIVRLAMLPLQMRQIRTTQAMSLLQPKIKELEKKVKDPQKRAQETMKLYKEHGLSPLGCMGPMIIQMPIWFALYQAVTQAMASSPENLLSLSQRLYSWGFLHTQVPVQSSFLWLDLSRPDPLPLMAVLVGASAWVQQKMMTMPSSDEKQKSMNNMMLWMMPAMFMVFTLSFPSGLALYWLASNVIGIAIQYTVTGWGGLRPGKAAKVQPAVAGAAQAVAEKESSPAALPPAPPADASSAPKGEKRKEYGDDRGKRQNRRRGHRHRSGPSGPVSGRGPGRGPQQG